MDIKICNTCHYNYVPNIIEDISSHKKYHDEFIHGIKVRRLKSDDEIANLNGFKIVLVSPKSSQQQRKRAERIARRAKGDTHFDFASYYANDITQKDYPLVFIRISNNRASAILVLRKNNFSAKVNWEDFEREDKNKIPLYPDVRWSISFIWTLESERRKGYAKQLIKVSSEFVECSVSELAWATPFTEFGYPLAKAISPNKIYLTV